MARWGWAGRLFSSVPRLASPRSLRVPFCLLVVASILSQLELEVRGVLVCMQPGRVQALHRKNKYPQQVTG